MKTLSFQTIAPIALLGIALVVLLFAEVPKGNENLVNIIVAGLLGFLARGDKKEAG